MSSNVFLEEFLGIKNICKSKLSDYIDFGYTGITCSHLIDSELLRLDRGGMGLGSNFCQTWERCFE